MLQCTLDTSGEEYFNIVTSHKDREHTESIQTYRQHPASNITKNIQESDSHNILHPAQKNTKSFNTTFVRAEVKNSD